MPDDLQIPVPGSFQGRSAPISSSYRPRRASGDHARLMTLGAVGLGGLLLVGTVGWAVMGRKPAEVPLIEADARPIRVKPENAGGQQFAGADEQVMGGQSTGAERMAPAAEVPAPQALRAQMQPAQAPAAPAPVAVDPSAPVIAAAPGVAGPGASPLPDTPLRGQPVARTAAVVPKPATPGSAVAGATMVQLAALESEAAAQAEWSKLSKRLPDLLGSRRLVVQKTERDGKPMWRVRTGGFSDVAEATSFCGKMRAKGASCTIASF